jgi:hypothetical protein
LRTRTWKSGDFRSNLSACAPCARLALGRVGGIDVEEEGGVGLQARVDDRLQALDHGGVEALPPHW